MIKGLLFDLDGVIVDTAKYHYLAWKKMADQLGYKFSIEDNELLKGVSRRKSLEIILSLNNASMSEEEIEKNLKLKNDIYLEYIYELKESEILPGVKEFIVDAKNKGMLVSLGSASKNSKLILERLNIIDLFDAIVDGTVISKAKPDPEVFTKGAELLGLKNNECIVFEDSIAGIEAAHNGDMRAIGVGNSSVKQFSDYYINDFKTADINVLIKKIEGK